MNLRINKSINHSHKHFKSSKIDSKRNFPLISKVTSVLVILISVEVNQVRSQFGFPGFGGNNFPKPSPAVPPPPKPTTPPKQRALIEAKITDSTSLKLLSVPVRIISIINWC